MHRTDTSPSFDEYTWIIEAEQVGQRLDKFLVPLLAGISRSAVQQLINEGSALVNRQKSKAGYMLRAGDEVQVLRTQPGSIVHDIAPRAIPLDIVYEDADVLIINKAAGMVVHPAPGHYDDTLVNALVARYPELLADEGDLRPGIVHRLDQDTSGLLIVARNIRAQAALVEQMKQHEIEKRYLALVEGLLELDQGSIDAPIGRDPRHRQRMAITAIQGREARTHFRVLQRYARHTLLLLQLETGRTHQIRVHLKAIGHPVAGDQEYGTGQHSRGIEIKRQFLHSYQLRFHHPMSGAALEFEAPLPGDLQTVLDQKERL